MIILKEKEKLVEDMVQNGYSVTLLAKKVGCSKAHISGIINHTRNPSAVIAIKICEQLKKQFGDYFFIESVHKKEQKEA